MISKFIMENTRKFDEDTIDVESRFSTSREKKSYQQLELYG